MSVTVISPSLMCADQLDLRAEAKKLACAGAKILHVDVMDGEFVSNIMLGTQLIKSSKKENILPLDIHLMIKDPDKKLEWFDFGQGDTVSVHAEAGTGIAKALETVRKRGAKAYLAINPATDIEVIRDYLDLIDGVLIMTVNPGAAGQPLFPGSLEKIANARRLLDSVGKEKCDLQVDGCVSFKYAPLMKKAGANSFVAGTSSVFSADGTTEENYKKLQLLLQ